MVILISSSVYVPMVGNTATSTALTNLVLSSGSLPMLFSMVAFTAGFFAGIIYSHEKDSSPVKPS